MKYFNEMGIQLSHALHFNLFVQRPAGSKVTHAQDRSRQQRADENYYNRYGSEYPRGLNRQNSFDMYDGE